MTNEYNEFENEFESPENSYHFTNGDDLPRDDNRPAPEEPVYQAGPYRTPEYRTPAPAV